MLTTARGINIHQHAEVRPPESHHGTAISLIDRPAGSGERRLVFLITLVMLLTFAAVVPFVNTPLSNSAAFVPTTSAAVLINDFITSVLLYSQGSIFPSRSLLLLASGYLFTALIIALHALTFPGAVTPAGLFDASLQTSPWLFFYRAFGVSHHATRLCTDEGYRSCKSLRTILCPCRNSYQRCDRRGAYVRCCAGDHLGK